jgi:hypothetical protein
MIKMAFRFIKFVGIKRFETEIKDESMYSHNKFPKMEGGF